MLPRAFRFLMSAALLLVALSFSLAQDADKEKDKDKDKDKPPSMKEVGGAPSIDEVRPGEEYRRFFKKPTTVPDYWSALKFEVDVGKKDLAALLLRGLLTLKPSEEDLVKIHEEEGMIAFLRLRNIRPWVTPVPVHEKPYLAEIARLEAALRSPAPAVMAGQGKWETAFPLDLRWRTLKPGVVKTKSGVAATVAEDGTIHVAAGAKNDTYTLELPLDGTALRALRIETLPDDRLPGKGPGHAGGNFILTRASVAITSPQGKEQAVAFNVAVAEIDYQDLWQRGLIACVTVSSDQAFAEQVLQSVEREAASMLGPLLVGATVEWLS